MIKAKFQCQNCNDEHEFSEGRISIVCQKCGCYDVKFDKTIVAIPSNYDPSPSIPQTIAKDDFFYGLTKGGCVWEISFPLEEPTQDSINTSKEKPKLISRRK